MLRVDPRARVGVWAACLVFAGLCLGWTLITPGFRGVDEQANVSSVSRIARTHSWPRSDEAWMDPAILAAFPTLGFVGTPWRDNPSLGRVRRGQGGDAPALAQLRAGAASAPRVRDPAGVHPPGYYAFMAVPYSGFGLDRESPAAAVLVLRLCSLALLIPVPWLCAAAASAMRFVPRAVVAAAFVPVAWIQFVHVGSIVNNGTLTTACVASVTALLVPVVLSRDFSRWRAAGVGLLTSVGLLTKGFALGLPITVAGAYAVGMARRPRRRAAMALGLAALACVPGVAWWLRDIGRSEPIAPQGSVGARTLTDYVTVYAPRAFLDLSQSLWVNLGWLNTPLPHAVHVPITALAFVVLATGSWRWRRSPWLLVVLHASWVIPLAMIVMWSMGFFAAHGFVEGMQGRYLFGGVVALAVLSVAAIDRMPRLLRSAPYLAVALGVGGWCFGLRSFWAPADPRVVVGWWPHGNVIALLAVVCVTAGCVLLWRSSTGPTGWDERPEDPGDPRWADLRPASVDGGQGADRPS